MEWIFATLAIYWLLRGIARDYFARRDYEERQERLRRGERP